MRTLKPLPGLVAAVFVATSVFSSAFVGQAHSESPVAAVSETTAKADEAGTIVHAEVHGVDCGL